MITTHFPNLNLSILFMGFQTWADLVFLDMTQFDIILSMTWLSPYYAVLNWNTKFVNLEIWGRNKLEWKGVYKPKQGKIISFIWRDLSVISKILNDLTMNFYTFRAKERTLGHSYSFFTNLEAKGKFFTSRFYFLICRT